MMQHFGEGGAGYSALEFFDHDLGLSLADRCTLTNMAVDCGAKNGLFIPDAITRDYLMRRDGSLQGDFDVWEEPLNTTSETADSGYDEVVRLDLSSLVPSVARPGSPADVILPPQ